MKNVKKYFPICNNSTNSLLWNLVFSFLVNHGCSAKFWQYFSLNVTPNSLKIKGKHKSFSNALMVLNESFVGQHWRKFMFFVRLLSQFLPKFCRKAFFPRQIYALYASNLYFKLESNLTQYGRWRSLPMLVRRYSASANRKNNNKIINVIIRL